LVDGDLRTRALSGELGKQSGRGLSTVLNGEAGVRDVLQPFGDMTLLSAGPSVEKPSHRLADGIAGVVNELRMRFDHVVVDTPPLPQFADALLISRSADSTLVVARPNKTRRTPLTDAVELLAEANTAELDIVLVGARRRWIFSRANSKHAKTIEGTPAANGSSNANGMHTIAELGDSPWVVPRRVPSSSTNGH
jgi:Mrp family chromosome partitioning ATPase